MCSVLCHFENSDAPCSRAILQHFCRMSVDVSWMVHFVISCDCTIVVTKVMFNWIISVQFHPLCFLVLPKRYFLYFIKGLKRSDHWRDEDNCLIPRPVPQAIEY